MKPPISHGSLVRFIASIIGSRDAEDVAQDVYVKFAANAVKPHRGQSSVETWVFAIAKKTAIDFLRNRAPRAVSWDELAESPIAVDPVEPEELSQEMQAALATLTVKQRAALLARAKHGPSVEDAAAWLGISPKAYRNRLEEARKRMRAALGEPR